MLTDTSAWAAAGDKAARLKVKAMMPRRIRQCFVQADIVDLIM